MRPEQKTEIKDLAEARNKRLFLQKTFSKQGFMPVSGIGFFDADFNPTTHKLIITIKANYVWQDGSSTNKWDAILQGDYKGRAKQLVEENWSQQYRIRCARPGWEDVFADVQIKLEEATSGYHYKYRVQKSNPGETLGGGISGSRGSFMALLSDLVLDETKSLTNKEQIFKFKMDQLKEALTACQAEMIVFNPNSSDLTPIARASLGQFAKKANQVLTDEVIGMKLYIYGSKGARDKTFSGGIADKRAKAVAGFLNSSITHQGFTETVSSTVKHRWLEDAVKDIAARTAPGARTTNFEGAALMIHVPKAFRHRQFVESHYIILLHEFGHCLGLPDEYMGIHDSGIANLANLQTLVPATVSKLKKAQVSDRVAEQQKGMAGYMDKTNVPSPVFIDTSSTGYSTTSVMSAGRDILPAHYLTIWASLATLTSEYIDPEEWKILPSAAAPLNMKHFKA